MNMVPRPWPSGRRVMWTYPAFATAGTARWVGWLELVSDDSPRANPLAIGLASSVPVESIGWTAAAQDIVEWAYSSYSPCAAAGGNRPTAGIFR